MPSLNHLKSSKSVLNVHICRFFTQAYDDRDVTVGEGFSVNNVHFDVHRFHVPLIYGRRGTPEDSEGIALCRYKPFKPIDNEKY
jgi:hypothetical protein